MIQTVKTNHALCVADIPTKVTKEMFLLLYCFTHWFLLIISDLSFLFIYAYHSILLSQI